MVSVGDARLYTFEWALPQAKAPRLFALLQQRGWPVLDAQVSWGPGSVVVQGPEVDYAIADAAEPAGGVMPTTVEGGRYLLVHGDGGPEAQMEENQTVLANQKGAVPALVATKGAFSRFAPGDSGVASSGLSFFGVQDESVFTEPVPQEQPVRD
jgi:hypothetical protein